MVAAVVGEIMKPRQPLTPAEWFDGIGLAIADARMTKPFGPYY